MEKKSPVYMAFKNSDGVQMRTPSTFISRSLHLLSGAKGEEEWRKNNRI